MIVQYANMYYGYWMIAPNRYTTLYNPISVGANVLEVPLDD